MLLNITIYICVCVYLVSPSFSQGPQLPETANVYVDQRALRVDRVVLLERGAPHSTCLMEGGKILPDIRVTIVHPDTKVPCAHTDLGEVCYIMYSLMCGMEAVPILTWERCVTLCIV